MHKNNLYINLGNTNVIVGHCKSDDLNDLKVYKFDTNSIKKDNKIINNIFSSLKEGKVVIKKVYISSVVSSLTEIFKEYLDKNKLWYKFISHKDVNFIDFSNLYNPYELGADLVVQMAYISRFFDEAIVISAGTALAIYHIKKSKLSGVIIKPGISKSIELLQKSTDIQKIEVTQTENVFGLSTNESVSIGVINDVIEYIEQIKKKINSPSCPIICSGGDYKLLDAKKWWHIDNLEILGLFTICNTKNK